MNVDGSTWILVMILGILVGTIGYFIRRLIVLYDRNLQESIAREKGYTVSIKAVTDSVQHLNETTMRIKTLMNGQQNLCNERHAMINKFIDDSEKRTSEQERALHKIELQVTRLNKG